MKKLFIIFIILNGLLLITNFSKADGLNSIYSREGFSVIAVGNNGFIIRSFDGGRTWDNNSYGSTNYYSISGKNQFVWIVGDNGILLSSVNGGNTFSQSTIAGGTNLRSVYFLNSTTGWIAGYGGLIISTTDGGMSWVQQTVPSSNNLSTVKFYDSQNGVACGENSTILVTSNGGASWTISPIPVNKNIFSADIFLSTIYASCQDATVLKSTNMGLNWHVIDYKIVTKSDINGIYAVSDNTFYSCGVGGSIRKSTDGGITFQFLPSPLFPDLYKMYFISSSGWAISHGTNVVLWTNDNGNSWNLPTGVVQNLSWTLKIPLVYYTSSGNDFCLSPFNKNEIFVTKSNKVYRSLDRGETWTLISTIPYGSISSSFLVSPKDSNVFLAAIDSSDNMRGKVMRSTNYGLNWTPTISANRSSDGTPLAIDPNHTDTIYYGTTDSVIFRSTNFGLTWNPAGPQIFAYNCVMKVLEHNSNIILCGAAEDTSLGEAHVYKSTNYGQSWIVVDSNSAPNFPELPDIVDSRMNPNVLYASFFEGTQGGLKRSTNKGSTWNYINIDNGAWGIDLAKDDPNTFCYADANSSASYYTVDGGIHFSPLPVSSEGNFAVFFYNRNTLFLQEGSGYYKLNISYSNPIGIKQISSNVPRRFYLFQNYPNPFNPSTKIKFEIPKSSFTRLAIYDEIGRQIAILVKQELRAGSYEIEWNAENYNSGIYFYRIISSDFTESKKMLLIK